MSDFMMCSRCGKTKILLKTWTEKVTTINSGVSELTYTQYSCPDSHCQQQIDEEQQKKRDVSLERERSRKPFSSSFSKSSQS